MLGPPEAPRGTDPLFCSTFRPTVRSRPVVGELYTWANHRPSPQPLIDRIENELLNDVAVLDFNKPCAIEFGRLNGQLLQIGLTVNPVDLMIASVALVHDLTLVTHNTRDFHNIPGLRLEDWLQS